jgi:hypothetical protein
MDVRIGKLTGIHFVYVVVAVDPLTDERNARDIVQFVEFNVAE